MTLPAWATRITSATLVGCNNTATPSSWGVAHGLLDGVVVAEPIFAD